MMRMDPEPFAGGYDLNVHICTIDLFATPTQISCCGVEIGDTWPDDIIIRNNVCDKVKLGRDDLITTVTITSNSQDEFEPMYVGLTDMQGHIFYACPTKQFYRYSTQALVVNQLNPFKCLEKNCKKGT